MQWYWDLTLKDNTVISVPPDVVSTIQRKMASKDAVNMRTRSVPYSEIKMFQQSDRPYTTQPLLHEAARAFDEPLTDSDGAIKCQWVKRQVTQDRWNKHYHHHPYYMLSDEAGMVMMAWFQPIHEVDLNVVSICSDEETRQLNMRRSQH